MMKSHFLSALLFASAALPFAAEAEAAPYQQYKVGVCGTSATCTITFPNVPSGKTVELTNVSCYVGMGDLLGIRKIQLQQVSSSNALGTAVSLIAAPYIIAAGRPDQQSVGIVNTPVTLYAKGGEKFRIVATLPTGSRFREMSCHVSGKLTP
jgi:hypothetical protein